MIEKVLVGLPEGIREIVRGLKGKLGESEVIKTIVIAYLFEKRFISTKYIWRC